MSEGMKIQPVVMNGNGDAGLDFDMEALGGVNRVAILSHLSPDVRRRVAALRKLQIDSLNVEVEFYKAIHDLEVEFQKKYAGVTARRRQIVNGESEPNEVEGNFPLFNPGEEDLADEFTKQCTVNAENDQSLQGQKEKGIPKFWLKTLQNFDMISDMIQENDEDVLKHLSDITVDIQKEPMTFTLSFHFTPNDYFTNTVLTKKYMLKCEIDERDPADFDGPEIVKSEGCKIDWKDGKNVTMKLIKKKQKNKKNPAAGMRFVTKEVKADSFFNFFAPPEHHGVDDEDLDENDRSLIQMDFEIGQMIRDTIVPHALFHFTGETEEEDDDFDEDEEDMEDEEGDDDGEDEEEE